MEGASVQNIGPDEMIYSSLFLILIRLPAGQFENILEFYHNFVKKNNALNVIGP